MFHEGKRLDTEGNFYDQKTLDTKTEKALTRINTPVSTTEAG